MKSNLHWQLLRRASGVSAAILAVLLNLVVSAVAQQPPGMPPGTSPPESDRSVFDAVVSVDAQKTTLLRVLDQLMKQADANYTLDSRLQEATIGAVRLHNVPLQVALDTVIKASRAPATYRFEGGVLMIMPRSDARAPQAAPGAPAAPAASVPPMPRVTLNCDRTSLYQALRQLFAQARIDFALDATLKDTTITVSLHNMPFEHALDVVLRASPRPVTCRVTKGFYSIWPRGQSAAHGAQPVE